MSEQTVDTRVAELRFDNSQFESGVRTSMSTIEKLKNALNFNGVERCFDKVERAANRCDVSGLSKGVETVSLKFSALETMAVAALTNITNTAVNAAKRLVNEFTLAPIYQGFEEYELKMGSVQTIMASTGESLETVNGYLAELNTYADRTIYSFSDMTRNIGKFTNSGVDLEKAVAAIQGISNEAAVSGANANEASRAMYNFAQALSSGAVKLIDWKSIENANMATVEFKEQLMATALEMGTIVKVGEQYQSVTEDANGSVSDLFTSTFNFNNSLSAQWMTTEVLVETLGRYADETTDIGKKAFAAAQDVKTFTQLIDTTKEAIGSGWATTFELIIGDFNEAKALFTEINNGLSSIIDATSDARNALIGDTMASGWGRLASKIEAAGVSAEVFQNEIIKTARSHGKNTEEMIKQAGSFEEAVARHMFAGSEIRETLERLGAGAENAAAPIADAASKLEELNNIADRVIKGEFGNGAERVRKLTEQGYEFSQVQDIVNRKLRGEKIDINNLSDAQMKNMGYTAEQIEAFRKLADELGDSELDELIKNMSKPSGRELLIDSVRNALKGLQGVLGTVKKAWDEVFPPLTADKLYGIIESIHKFSESLILGDKYIYKLQASFTGLFSAADIVLKIFKNLTKTVWDFASGFLPAADDVLRVTANIGTFFTELNRAMDAGNAVEYLTEVFDEVLAKLKDYLNITSDISGTDIMGGIAGAFERVKAIGGKLLSMLSGVGPAAEVIFTAFKKVSDFIVNALHEINTAAKSVFTGGGFEPFLEIFNSGMLAAIAIGVKNFIGSLSGLTGLGDSINSVFGAIKGSLSDLQNTLKSEALVKIATAIGIFTISAIALSAVDAGKLGASLGAMAAMLTELFGAMAIFEAASGGNVLTSVVSVNKVLLPLAGAVLILSFALAKLSAIPLEDMQQGAGAIAAIMYGLILFLNNLDAENIAGLGVKNGLAIIAIAAALNIMSGAVEQIGRLDIQTIGRGLFGIGTMLTALGVFLSNITPLEKMLSTSVGIAVLGGAMLVFASAVEKFGVLDIQTIGKGLFGIGTVFTALGVFLNNTGNPSNIMATSVGVAVLGGAMLIFANAVEMMGNLPLEVIGKGLLTMAVALAEVTIAMRTLPGDMLAKGIGMLAVGGAITVLAAALKSIGGMSWEEIGKGLAVLAGSLVLITAAMVLMKGAVGGAAAMLIFSAALAVLAPTLKLIGSMSMEEIASALLAVAGSFLVFGIAGVALGGIAPQMMLVAAAIALMGIACAGAGIGLTAFSAGLTILAVSGGAGVSVLIDIFKQIISLIPWFIAQVGVGLVLFADVIAKGSDAFVKAFTTIFLAIIESVDKIAPELTMLVIKLVNLLCDAVIVVTPKIEATLTVVLNSLLALAKRFLPDILDLISVLIDQIIGIVSEKAHAIIDVLGSILTAVIDKVMTAIEQILDGISSVITRIDGIFSQIQSAVTNRIQSLIDSVFDILGGVAENCSELSDEICTAVRDITEDIGSVFETVIDTVKNTLKDAIDAYFEIVSDIPEKLKNLSDEISDLATGIFDDLCTAAEDNTERFADCADKILDILEKLSGDMSEKLPLIVENGGDMVTGILDGIGNNIDKVSDKGVEVVKKLADGISSRLSELIQTGFDLVIDFCNGLADKIRENSGPVANAFGNVASAVCDGIITAITSGGLDTAGENSVMGFVNGIGNVVGKVKKSGNAIGQNLIDSVKTTLQIHSPSWIMTLLGRFAGEGVVVGVNDRLDDIYNSGNSMASSLFSGANDGLMSMLSSNSLSSSLDSKGFGGITNFLKGTFGDIDKEIADKQLEIDKAQRDLEKAMNPGKKKTVDSVRVQELTEKLNGLNKEMDHLQQLKSAGGFNLDDLFKNLDAGGLSALDGIITEDFLSALSPEELESFTGALDDAVAKQVSNAKKEYDELFKLYKDGKITQAEYDKEYLGIYSKYTDAQTELTAYSADKMTEYVSDKIEDLRDNYEDKIKEIQNNIDDFTKDHTTSYEAALTFTTNRDVYDQTVDDYEKKIYAINEKLEKEEKLHGKDTYTAQNYRKEIEKLTEKMEEYKKSYEHKVKLDGLDEDEIVDVKFTDKIKKNKQLMADLLARIKELKKKGVGAELLKELGQMDPKEALAAAKYLNSMDDSALKSVDKNKKEERATTEEIAKELWGDDIASATETYVSSVNAEIAKLPDSAKQVGYAAAVGLAEGFEESTAETLSRFGVEGGKIAEAITNPFAEGMAKKCVEGLNAGITDITSTGVIESAVSKIGEAFSEDMANGIAGNLVESLDSAAKSEEMKKVYSSIGSTIDENVSVQPVIRPSLDLTDVYAQLEPLDTIFTSFEITAASGSVNRSRQSSMRESVNESQPNAGRSFTFNQYNSSPEPLNTREIRQKTTQGWQLMSAAYLR